MAKFKFKGTTTEDVEEELEKLCTMDAKEIPLNHIIKVVSVHYFGVHKVHKGKGEDLVMKVNFKQYMMPHLRRIIAIRKAKGI